MCPGRTCYCRRPCRPCRADACHSYQLLPLLVEVDEVVVEAAEHGNDDDVEDVVFHNGEKPVKGVHDCEVFGCGDSAGGGFA